MLTIVLDGGSHEELWRRWVVTGGAGLSEAAVGHFFTLHFVGISLSGQPADLKLQLLHLLDQGGLLGLQVMLLLDPLVPARLGIASVFKGSPFLFQTDDIVFGEASQVPVEFSDRHGDQLVVGEPVFYSVVGLVLEVIVLQLLGRAGTAAFSWGTLVMVVMVMVVRMLVWMNHLFMRDALVLVVMVVVMMVVVVASVAIVALKLWWHLVGADESFHSVLWGEVEGLRVHLLVRARHPVQIFQVALLLCWAEAWRGGHRAARGADGSGRHGAGRLQAVARSNGAFCSVVQRFLLDFKLHQIKVVDIFHCKGTGG